MSLRTVLLPAAAALAMSATLPAGAQATRSAVIDMPSAGHAAALAGEAAPAPDGEKEKAIFAVSDDDARKWSLTLGNIDNAIAAIGAGHVDVELVAYGPGIAMLEKDSRVADRVAAALRAGVRVAACANSMRGAHLAAADLMPGVTVVPSGVVELIRRQHGGWAYVRS